MAPPPQHGPARGRSFFKDFVVGGPSRNRTGVQGFAVLCVTTPPSGLNFAARFANYMWCEVRVTRQALLRMQSRIGRNWRELASFGGIGGKLRRLPLYGAALVQMLWR